RILRQKVIYGDDLRLARQPFLFDPTGNIGIDRRPRKSFAASQVEIVSRLESLTRTICELFLVVAALMRRHGYWQAPVPQESTFSETGKRLGHAVRLAQGNSKVIVGRHCTGIELQ